MKSKILTAKTIALAKAGAKQIELPVGGVTGGSLYLVIHPSGKKTWRFRYRYRGRTRGVMFKQEYPQLSLSAARAQADAMVDELKADKDPAAVQSEELKSATPESVKNVFEEWLKRCVDVQNSERTAYEYARLFRKEVLPRWQDKYISEIKQPDVLRVIDALSDREVPAFANKVMAVLKSFFSWCIERGYIDFSPAHQLKPPAKLISRERVLDDSELSEVWTAVDAFSYPSGPFLRCLILLAQRRGEIASMRWSDLDLEQALWIIPPEFMKSGREHVVPLSAPVVEILKKQPRFKGDFVFSSKNGTKRINSFGRLKVRMDAEIAKHRNKAGIRNNFAEWFFHDLRRTSATRMAELGVMPHVLSAVLSHSTAASASMMPSASVTRIYNRYSYLDEKRGALEAWGKYVHSLEGTAQKAATA